MRISIGFSGAAGSGVNTSGLLLGQLLSKKGYSVLGDKEYASIIKGDNNDFFLYISDTDYFITQTIDYFFAFDDYAVTKNTNLYTLKQVENIKDQTTKFKNTFCFGAALKLLGIPFEEGKQKLAELYSADILEQNIVCLQQGYDFLVENPQWKVENLGVEKKFMFGNEVIAKGAIASGMDFYGAYPMTPASSLIDVVTEEFQRMNQNIPENKKNVFFQGEDEIAVSISMLGAKFAGKRAACGTSGGGFALMTESISFSNQAEIGGLYILSQRDGPSTGTPTFTGQGDLNYALNASFGDTFPIVLAPSTFEESYRLIGKALNRSDQYQHPVIYLIDKQLSEGYLSIDPKALIAEEINRGKLFTGPKYEGDYRRYAESDDGISPYLIPGTENGEFITTSYEHDETGATNEDPIMKKAQQDKRDRKLGTFIHQEFNENFYGYEIINPDAEVFFITYGVNRYVLADYVKDRKDFGLIIMKVFQPFDMRLKTFLDEKCAKIKLLTFVEMNASGQMQERVTNKCWLHDKKREGKISHHRKYTLYPIFLEEIQGN
ncbi:MAG: hypothetical protein NTX91_03390 [candidate division SR1 bacterium]|nr:hypothetical protein [candidate division SR1 bacterium]